MSPMTGISSGRYSPPSGESPCKTASSNPSFAAWPRVEKYFIFGKDSYELFITDDNDFHFVAMPELRSWGIKVPETINSYPFSHLEKVSRVKTHLPVKLSTGCAAFRTKELPFKLTDSGKLPLISKNYPLRLGIGGICTASVPIIIPFFNRYN